MTDDEYTRMIAAASYAATDAAYTATGTGRAIQFSDIEWARLGELAEAVGIDRAEYVRLAINRCCDE